ncbi:carbohydrate ABC transporter permease [bacterium]|nr:carbohydrate ABC transporter permease [bacterium]
MSLTENSAANVASLSAGDRGVSMIRISAIRTIVRHLVLVTIAFTMVLPFLWMVLTSLKPLDEVGLRHWIPKSMQWGNYREVFDVIPFARFYWNNLFVATWVTLLHLVTSSFAAYSFSRIDWPGRDRIFVLYLSTMMLPGLVLMIPNYQIMVTLGLVDTLPGLIIPVAFSPFGTFLLRQFMMTIPRSLDEAAAIDGAGRWRTFWDVILPLARPGLITLAIFTFVSVYQSFFWPLVMLKSIERYTLPVGLLFFDSTAGQATHLLMAAVTMSVLPMIVLFVFLQKFLVSGIQLGSVKG